MSLLSFILAQCLSALSQAAILFFIACGLTLIFGIMRIVNFAHGVIFMHPGPAVPALPAVSDPARGRRRDRAVAVP
jgi:branched-subunit amino acid ABC-type transport system permease component